MVGEGQWGFEEKPRIINIFIKKDDWLCIRWNNNI
jgi:hypothetical protein